MPYYSSASYVYTAPPSTSYAPAYPPPAPAPPDIDILSMESDSNQQIGLYRVRVRKTVIYVTLQGPVFSNELNWSWKQPLVTEFAKIPQIAKPSYGSLTYSVDPNTGQPSITVGSSAGPVSISPSKIFHPTNFDVLTFRKQEMLMPRTDVVTVGQDHYTKYISKISRFAFEVPRSENELDAYRHLVSMRCPLIPRYLGNVKECGRYIGFLMEKIEGEEVRESDMPACRVALEELHRYGVCHGDVNKNNFIKDTSGRIRILDLETAGPYSADGAAKDLAGCKVMFQDMMNLGGKQYM